MPQFVVTPGGPKDVATDSGLTGSALPSKNPYKKPPKPGLTPAQKAAKAAAAAAAKTKADAAAAAALKNNEGDGGGAGSGEPTTKTPAAPTTPAKTPAEIKAAKEKAAKAKADKAAANAQRLANRYNPLMTSFDSPQEQARQASSLALLGNPTEAALRAQSAQQQAGITGLTTALQGRLGQINTQNIASNAGLADIYSQIAAQSQSAGNTAAAAAGGPTGLAAGGNPMVASNAANLNAQTMGLVPAAGFQGNVFSNQASSALTKALVDRASNVSSDTAKYLKQIQDQAYVKATGQQTIAQNAALLGIKQDTLASQNVYRQGQLQNTADSNQIKLLQYQRQVKADLMKYGGTSRKPLESAMKRILDQQISLTASSDKPTGLNTYQVQVIDPITQSLSTKTVYGADAASAVTNTLGAGVQISGQAVPMGPQTISQPPNKTQLVSSLASQLVLASRKTNSPWTMAKATKWILANSPSIAALP